MVLVRRMWTVVIVMGGAMVMRSMRSVVVRSMRSVVVRSMRSVVLHEARCSSLVHWLRSNSEFGERRVS